MRDDHDTLKTLESFARLADTLEALDDLAELDAGQRHVVARRVAKLLANRERFMLDFQAAWTSEDVAAYAVLRGADVGVALLDEAMHLFALAELTLVDGAETRGHLERTAAYARLLATARGESPGFCATLELAATIHDVGLVVVPEEVIASRGQVDSYESQLIDAHTRIGAALVTAVVARLGIDDGPLAVGCEIVRCHHERFDGLGPLGLAGGAIPYPARLFAIADVYDTLRRQRPHRDALDHAAAVVALRAGNRDGRVQFDPELLPAFLACEREFSREHEAHPDSRRPARGGPVKA